LSKRIYLKEVNNYQQENLVEKLLGEKYSARNALANFVVLKRLFNEKLAAKCDW
jgi:hypothetical protein